MRRAPGNFEGSEAPILQTVSPVPVTMNIDGVDMKYEAEIVIDGYFPQGLCLGINELRCYNIGNQGAVGEARIDDKVNLVMTFTHPQAPVPLKGLIDTGSGVSILSLEAYNAIAPGSTYCIKPYDIHFIRSQRLRNADVWYGGECSIPPSWVRAVNQLCNH